MSTNLTDLLKTLDKIEEGTSKRPGSVLSSPYGVFRDLDQAQKNFKPKKRKTSLLGSSVKKTDDPFRGKLVGSCEESKQSKLKLNMPCNESKPAIGSHVSFPEHGKETDGVVVGYKKSKSNKKSVMGSGLSRCIIDMGHGNTIEVPLELVTAKPISKQKHRASMPTELKESLQSICQMYPNAVSVQTARKYQIVTEEENISSDIPPTVIGQGDTIRKAWINAEERINDKIVKYVNTIRKVQPLAVSRNEGRTFWIKESPNGDAISYSRSTLLEAWKNAADRIRPLK